MPEIAEIARIVHFLRIHLVGKTIASASAIEDNNVFGKVGTTGAAVETALKGRKVISAGTQGKYFWITLDRPPHLVMHFGMTGWIHIRGEKTAYTNYYKKMKDSELEQWPPKFWKFHLTTTDKNPVEIAFTDARRFGRVRLVDCPGADIRKHSPLVENGPDPVVDTDRFTYEYLRGKMQSRHVPVKALLLDQAVISGVGNWVADETLYNAKMHPEQYSDSFTEDEIKTLYDNIVYVCKTAVDLLGDSDQFPEHWLFNYRWGKGGKGASSVLPNGEKLAFITVGGRTSCYAPAVQRKTGQVVSAANVVLVKAEEEEEGAKPVPKKKAGGKKKAQPTTNEVDVKAPPAKKRKTSGVKQEQVKQEMQTSTGRRRSARLGK